MKYNKNKQVGDMGLSTNEVEALLIALEMEIEMTKDEDSIPFKTYNLTLQLLQTKFKKVEDSMKQYVNESKRKMDD